MQNILIRDKKYLGQYVAIKDFDKPVVVAHGKNPKTVQKSATKKGFAEPVILFVPTKGMVQIY
ncbi:MAG: hypothetical protein JW983_03425 [Elusimicrobia bacterium]|nr:hypothetical protein [Elusimicrobiota bacterium]